MTIAQKVAIANINLETATKSGEFIAACRLLMQAYGDNGNARQLAEAGRFTPRVVEIIKQSVNAGTLADSSNAAPLAEYNTSAQAFLASLRNIGAFDRLVPDMLVVPLRTPLSVATSGASGSGAVAGQVKPISKLALAGSEITESKSVAIVVLTDTVLKLGGAFAQNILNRELRSAVALTTDQTFISTLTAGLSPTSIGGTNAFGVYDALNTALQSMNIDAESKLYILVESGFAKKLAVQVNSTGSRAFEQMTPNGGSIAGIPVVVSDGLSSDTLVVVDAHQIAASPGVVAIDASRNAVVQMDTSPDSPQTASTVVQNLYQENKVALRAERLFGVERLRDASVAVISGLSYSGNSPA